MATSNWADSRLSSAASYRQRISPLTEDWHKMVIIEQIVFRTVRESSGDLLLFPVFAHLSNGKSFWHILPEPYFSAYFMKLFSLS